MSIKFKLGRNDPCVCGSGKKFKKCCIDRLERIEKQKQEQLKQTYISGHPIENEHLKYIHDWFKQQPEYADFNVIDVSNVLTPDNYRTIQTEHYHSAHGNTIILAYRNEQNEAVFTKRSPTYTNVLVMFKGAYQIFTDFSFGNITDQIRKMIDLRIQNKDYHE